MDGRKISGKRNRSSEVNRQYAVGDSSHNAADGQRLTSRTGETEIMVPAPISLSGALVIGGLVASIVDKSVDKPF